MIVVRRSKLSKKFNYYKVCPNCKGHYSKYGIRKHYPKCIPDYEKGDRSVHLMGKFMRCQIHKKASDVLQKVFTLLRDDEVTQIIRYDEFVITYGNTLCEKYRLPHFHKMIRAKLRLIGRFLLETKLLDKSIDSFSCIFVPNKFDVTLQAVNKIGNIDSVTKTHKAPSSATEIGSMLKKCCKLFISVCIKEKNQLKKRC